MVFNSYRFREAGVIISCDLSFLICLLWIRYKYSDLLTGFSWTITYLNLWFVNLCYVSLLFVNLWYDPFELNICYEPCHEPYAMNLWFELWLWTLPFVNLWLEPLLCTFDFDDLDFAIWFTFDPSVLYPSIFLAMKVTWSWHWCTNVMTPVWSSDVPHRPFVWSAFGLGRGVWMHYKFDLICYYIWFGVWYCVQYMPFTLFESWSLHGYYAEDFVLFCLARGRMLI